MEIGTGCSAPKEDTMDEQTQRTTTQTSTVPARIELEDLIEAVTRGVARALAAEDDVSGYAYAGPGDRTSGLARLIGGPLLIGIILNPPDPGGVSGAPDGSKPIIERPRPSTEKRY